MSRRARAALAVGAAFALCAAAGAALAHEEPYSHLDVRLEPGGLHGRLTAHVVDLAHEAGIAPPESLLDRSWAERHRAALDNVLGARLHIIADGQPVTPRWGSFEPVPERKALAFEWSAALPRTPSTIEVQGPLFPYDPPHETYLNLYEAGALRHQDLLDRRHTLAVYYSGTTQGRLEVVRRFVLQGIHHIFIGPDHILFVVGLLLLGGSLVRLLKIVTAFTLAHSVTLALATLRIVDPPPRVIEPAIALSIVVIGIETLYAMRQGRDWRAPIAFAFGFIHGFGFASVLRDLGLPQNALGWSLAAFNLGVEIGQAAIVLAVAPALGLLRGRAPGAARRAVTVGAIVIVAAGAWWFYERVR